MRRRIGKAIRNCLGLVFLPLRNLILRAMRIVESRSFFAFLDLLLRFSEHLLEFFGAGLV